MEQVYNSRDLDHTSDDICLRDFFNDAILQHHPLVSGSIFKSGTFSKRQKENAYREKVMDLMDTALTDSEFTDLETMCSSDNFRLPGCQHQTFDLDHQRNQFQKIEIPKDSELETLKRIKSRRRIHERNLKHTGVVWLDKYAPQTSYLSHPADSDLVPGTELVVVVRLYAPFRHTLGKRSSRVAMGGQEIMVLGSQTLADLRDSFTCPSDNIICQDSSSNPFQKSRELAKEKYKSGMIYIGKTFYDDTRYDSNIEYSNTVLQWAHEKRYDLGYKAKMQETKIIDLTVKLGYPYLYQHQGNCEHLFCFSDIRLLHQSDVLKLSKYPVLKSFYRQRSRFCMLCGHYIAKWLTVGNTRVPHDPCYFCQSCFISYNYKDRQKIGNFAAYPFSDPAPDAVCPSK